MAGESMMMESTSGALSPPPKRGNPDSYHTAKVPKSKTCTTNYSNHAAKNQYVNFPAFPEVRTAAQGKWESIHRTLGIQLTTTSHTKHTACPGCGGRDRFRLDASYQDTGRWICGGGGDMQSGDGFSLLGHVFGWTPLEQLKAVSDYLGLSNASDKERETLRFKAEAQAAAMQVDAQRKDEQARRDSNLLTMLENQIDAIRHRQYLQRQISGTAGMGRFTLEPTEDELSTAYALNMMILENYAQHAGQGNP